MREYSNKKPEEMTMDEMIDEVCDRIIESKTTFRYQIDAAMENGGVKDNPALKEITKLDTENNRRIQALRSEMMTHGMDWIDVYSWPKSREEGQLNA